NAGCSTSCAERLNCRMPMRGALGAARGVRPWRPARRCRGGAWGKPTLKGYCVVQMANGPDDEDLITDLRASFAEDVAEAPTATEPAQTPARAVVAPPPLPTRRSTGDRKPSPPHPLEDPFQEPSEPRMPHGLPEEKVEFFRVV